MNKTRILRWFIGSGLLAVTFVSGVILYVQTKEIGFIKPDAVSIEEAPYAIVLGASVTESGNASDALMDRILTGVELYRAGKVDKILMTGDDGAFHIDEVRVMARIATELGVPATDLVVDGHGYRTYESCKRAKEVFQIDRAVIVTQRFHLARALYLCRSFGIEIQGLAADRQTYQKIIQFTTRDLLSSFKAWFDINIYSPKPPV
ncbi:YdcF family protein [Candidatus Uhrbacteria bacterium]|nr:YdcF family protein [Candidatus Uhrbacteria bacterium]